MALRGESLVRIAAVLEAPVRAIGVVLAGLVVLVVIGEFAVVALRYGWQSSPPWLREGVLALNGAVFLLGMAWALQRDEHVRVDVFSRRLSPRARAAIELGGMLLVVLPFAIFVLFVSDEYVLRSHAMGERSGEPGGLPMTWLQKALIPAMGLLLAVQAVASGLRALARLVEPEASR
jgi:TRAP-type mannitol/chloroaromatic compound transport system permease small subunit